MTRKTKEDIDMMVELYNSGKTIKQVAKIIGSNAITVSKYLRLNTKLRPKNWRPPHPNNSFSLIDNISAYWLGFIAADGHIRDAESNDRQRDATFTVEISERDLSHLHKLKDYVGEGNIYKRGRNDGCYIYACRRHYIVDNLSQWLPVNNKTEQVIIPNMLTEVEKGHFMRGYIDGDGHITSSGSIQITSCANMINSIKEFFNMKHREYQKKNNKAITLIYNKKESLDIFNLVNANTQLRLDRKWCKIK